MKKFLTLACTLFLSGCQIALPGIGDQKVTIQGTIQTGAQVGSEQCPNGLYMFNPFPFEDQLYLQLRWDKETLFDETQYTGVPVTIEGTLPDQSSGICAAKTCECARYLIVNDVQKNESAP